MPHVTIQYTANLDPDARIDALCATLAEVICAQRDDERPAALPDRRHPRAGLSVPRPTRWPTARPTAPSCYVNVRIAPGRARERGCRRRARR